MQAFTQLDGLVAPLDRANVDTDAIIPEQFLKSVKRSGFGPNLFDERRYLDHGEPGVDVSNRPLNREFVLNAPRFRGAQILRTRENFGSGSSGEHAPWALKDYGFRALIGTTFADIFFNNCVKNGVLPIRLSQAEVDALFAQVSTSEGYRLKVDLDVQTVTRPDSKSLTFEVEPFRRHCLLNGLDDIGLTLRHADKIRGFEDRPRAEQDPGSFRD